MDEIFNRNCLEGMRELPADSVDAIVTDPPYNLGFMGREWDTFGKSPTGTENEKERQEKAKEYAEEHKGAPRFANSHGSGKTTPAQAMAFQSSMTETFSEALRVAKPGAYLLAFGGTRTYHRLACAIEDAGWEIRDCLGWLYGSGFPKSMDVSKAIDKLLGARREVVGFSKQQQKRTPAISTSAYGDYKGQSGDITAPATDSAKQWEGWGTALKPAWEPIVMARKPLDGTVAHNVLEYGTGAINIDACRVGTETIITQGGDKFPGVYGKYATCEESMHAGRFPANIIHDGSDEATAPMGDASRFFYCAKASKKDRGEGNNHPTVKPQALMQYLIRLVTPECAVVLDPFLGSGSTAVAAMATGRHYLGYELLPEYFDIARARLDAAKKEYTL